MEEDRRKIRNTILKAQLEIAQQRKTARELSTVNKASSLSSRRILTFLYKTPKMKSYS